MTARACILLVDDDRRVTGQIREALADRGYEVETLHSPFDLLARLQRSPEPDLMLLDIHLPGLTGDGLLAKIRNSADYAHLSMPVVFISGLSRERLMDASRRAQADAWLEKPVDRDRLHATIARLLQPMDRPVDLDCSA